MKRLLVAAVLTFSPLAAGAQQTEAAEQESSGDIGDRLDEHQAELQGLNEKDARNREEIEGLKRENAEQKAKLEALEAEVAEVRENQELSEALGGEEYDEKIFSLWGFFDLTFNKFFYEKNSPYNIYINPNTTFLMSNINLYFKSQMTRTLSAILEVRFSYLPQGADVSLEYSNVPGTEYEYVDSEIYDPLTTALSRSGSIYVERIHLNYSPVQWFNVVAGRYLTPYGIWNIDHGSPVVLPVRIPYMQIREMVPLAQTGLQVCGRVFPTSGLFFDYAVTLSNGRGPADAVMDLDENKAIGLKLKLSHEGGKARFGLGGYGYYGRFTAQKKVVSMVLDEEGHLDESADQPLSVARENVIQYDEVAASADLLAEISGLRLQSEYVWRRSDPTKPVPFNEAEVLFAGGNPLVDHYYLSSYIGQGVYALLAYDLPLPERILPLRIIPYVLFEYNDAFDTLPYAGMIYVTGGVNLKPSPFVTIKLEYGYGKSTTELMGKSLQEIAAQLAVSY